jgi:hypothetical protein
MRRCIMTDLLIRDVALEVISALDAKAKIQGISRVELLRQIISREAMVTSHPLTEEHLFEMVKRLPDLGNPEFMRGAWS